MLLLVIKYHTHYHLHPFHFVLFKVKNLVAKQHPTNTHMHTHTHIYNTNIVATLHITLRVSNCCKHDMHGWCAITLKSTHLPLGKHVRCFTHAMCTPLRDYSMRFVCVFSMCVCMCVWNHQWIQSQVSWPHTTLWTVQHHLYHGAACSMHHISLVPRPLEQLRKNGLVSTVCARAAIPRKTWGSGLIRVCL